MNGPDLAKLDRDALVALVLKQAATIEVLTAGVEELTRSGKPRAAPSSKGTRSKHPKKPARKPGEGTFSRRLAPSPEQPSEPPIEVKIAETACLDRGGTLDLEHFEDASITDLPEVPRPRVRPFRLAVARCRGRGQRARGRDPRIATDRRGATAHRLGPRLLAAAHHLHHGLGVPVRKLPELLRLLTGAAPSQGAITLDAPRKSAGAVGARYRELCESVRHSSSVHTDDTGRREPGVPKWPMSFVTDTATVDQVRPRHRDEEVREQVPADHAGAMITDRGVSHEAAEPSGAERQKCLAHIGRSLSAALEKKVGPARWSAGELRSLLGRASASWHERRAGPVVADFDARAAKLKIEASWHRRDRPLSDPEDRRLLQGLGRHHDAGSLLRSLDDPTIEPTNDRAQRASRPAVIAREVSHRAKSARGGGALEAWRSALVTLSRTVSGPAPLDAVVALVHPAAPQPA